MPIFDLEKALTGFFDWMRGGLTHIPYRVRKNLDETIEGIVDIKEMDCGGDWVLYVRMAIPSAIEALWIILTPTGEEIFQSYLEPKAGRRGQRRGGRGDRHNRKNKAGKQRRYFFPPIPDIDNEIADRVPGRGFFAGRKLAPGEWIFWTGFNIAERVGWYWILLGATHEFVTTYQSGLMESGRCAAGGLAYAKIHTLVHSGAYTNPLWFVRATLPVGIEHGLQIGNNGDINLAIPDTLAAGFALVTTHWTCENTSATEEHVVQVGFFFTAYQGAGKDDVVLQKASVLTVAPNSIGAIDVGGRLDFVTAFHWHGYYYQNTIKNSGGAAVDVESDVAVQVEAIGNV